ncbi:MAG: 16S rRNA (uracil(1498)-N(3))-methyltransferase [Bacteroidales bacterium]|jgi:16S rRNA (uracil1498-N3)-methyltransferase|nr:16S rRNA (uracil(1498)-N(3))-methyltransferase [Bacteroidales bacterium]
MRFFYDNTISGNHHILSEDESNHCARVLRLKVGDEIFIADGQGNLYRSQIENIDHKHTSVRVVETIAEYNKLPYSLHIAIAPTKNMDRMEWFLEKATEIGISEITPIICHNSERKVIKTDRMNRIVESAMKQSYKAYHPKVNEAVKFLDFVKKDCSEQKFVAHCDENSQRTYLADIVKPQASVTVLIGPEGDFSHEEIELALQNYKPITLGNSRLRTETAALVACDIVSIINQMGK